MSRQISPPERLMLTMRRKGWMLAGKLAKSPDFTDVFSSAHRAPDHRASRDFSGRARYD
jgi:hypothetical protein